MSGKSQLTLICSIIALGFGTWLLADRSHESSPKSGRETPLFSICNSNDNVLLLDSLHGKTWMLRSLENGKPAWLPVTRIDSEKEGTQSWQKTSILTVGEQKNGKPLSLDSLLKERGYVALPLKLLNTGHLCINLRIEGKKTFVAVDTGTPFSYLGIRSHVVVGKSPHDRYSRYTNDYT